MIRTYVVVGVLLRGFFATTRKQYVVKTSVKKRHRIFCQKEVYRDSTRYIGIPLGSVEASIADFHSMYRTLAKNTPIYLYLAAFKRHTLFLPEIGIPVSYTHLTLPTKRIV